VIPRESGIREDTLAKISWGVLAFMGVSLMTGTAYVVTLANAQEEVKKQVIELQRKQAETSQLQTDVAVLKSQMDAMNYKLDDLRRILLKEGH
jgi:hypothetical protein